MQQFIENAQSHFDLGQETSTQSWFKKIIGKVKARLKSGPKTD
jgi:hypothetical protein|tara:strand:- start:1065 stop:1193 length:129 start_codon:yes stop_codon:yes gene_type:complete